MQWQWEKILNNWNEKKKDIAKSDLVIEFIRYFYLDGLVYDYIFQKETNSLEDLKRTFEQNMDNDGNLPNFPFEKFQSEIMQEADILGLCFEQISDAILKIISISHCPPCFVWPSDLDKLLRLWLEKAKILKFYKNSNFREAVKKHISELITLAFFEAEQHALTLLSILEENNCRSEKISSNSFKTIPTMVLQKNIETKEKNIERALAWFKKICPPHDGCDYIMDKTWIEELLTIEVINFLQGDKEFAVFDFEIIRIAAQKLGGYTFEKYMEFLVKNELKKRIIKKQNEKMQKLEQKNNSIALIRSKQEDHFRYLSQIIQYSSYLNPANKDFDDNFD